MGDAGEFEELVVAEEWEKAHDLFVTSLAPKAHQQRDMSGLLRMLSHLAVHAEDIGFENWESGGGVYDSYVKIKVGVGVSQ